MMIDNSGVALMIDPHKSRARSVGAVRVRAARIPRTELSVNRAGGKECVAKWLSICQPIVGKRYRQERAGRVYFLLKMVGE